MSKVIHKEEEITMEYTSEQQKIINSVPKIKDCMKINAYAGTGKTFTLIAIAKRYPNSRFLYLAFNKAIADEAKLKFPANVVVKTTHGLAYPYIVRRGEKVRGEYRVMEIAEITSQSYQMALHTSKLLTTFFNSAFQSIRELVSCYQENGDSIPGLAVSGAEKIYKKLKNRELDITHSFYLKEFQLVTPPINFDYVMLDEAQDSNDVTLDMFFKLQGRKIIVGDTHQQIYAFRGSVDAIQNIHADISLSLTKTFRCRPAIVSAANFILSYYKKESQPIESVNKNVEKPITQAYITRTNAALIGFVAEFDEFSLTRKADEIFKSSLSVYYFIIKTHHLINPEFKFLTKFSGVSELQKYIEDTNDIELKMALTMATDYGSKLVQLLEKAKQNQYTKSKLTLTTAHSSKGLEFDSTILWDDFPSLMAVRDDEKLTDVEKDNEYNLLYVAVTRARYSIENLTVNSFTVSAVS